VRPSLVRVIVTFLAALAMTRAAPADDEPTPGDDVPEATPIDGDGSSPRADDLLGGRLFRGPVARPRLRVDGPRTFEVAADGTERLVAVSISGGGTIAAWLLPPDEALAIPPELLAGLRGIAFEGWRPQFERILARIDGPHCFVKIAVGLHRKLPALPEGLRALAVEGFLTQDVLDLAPLRGQTSLLRLDVVCGTVADWSPLAGMKGLRHLTAEIRPAAAPTVPTLPALVSWSAAYDEAVTDIAFVERFPALETLDVSGTGAADLTPIARLPSIREVIATQSGVSKLPAGRVPSLRSLRILGHRVPAAELLAFADANPQCRIDSSWRARLDVDVAGADGLRLRTGGQCHRDADEEQTLYETHDAEEIRGLLAAIEIDEAESRGHCLCCGGPTIEFLRGGEIVASVTNQHGQALRFPRWPGDGPMTPDSADAFCAWMRARGVAGIESPREAKARTAREVAARDAAFDAVLGADRGARARAATDRDAFAAIVREAAPETEPRILLLLRMPHEASGDDKSPGAIACERAEDLLDAEDPAVLATVLLRLLTDPATPRDLALAAARTFDRIDLDRGPLTKEARAALRLPAARAYVAAGGALRISWAISLVRGEGTPEAFAFLRSLLPPCDEKLVPLSTPTREEMDRALELARILEEADWPRLRALAAASQAPEKWGKWIEEELERRPRAKPPEPAPAPKAE
jgi:hypothetical protein